MTVSTYKGFPTGSLDKAGQRFGLKAADLMSLFDELEENESNKQENEFGLPLARATTQTIQKGRGGVLGYKAPQKGTFSTTKTFASPDIREVVAAPPASQLNFDSQIEGLKQTLLDQSELLKNLGKKEEPTKPVEPTTPTEPTKPVEPAKIQTPSERINEQLTGLYRNILNREPEEAGLNYYTQQDSRLSDKIITSDEYAGLERDFMASPEYNLKKLYKEELGREPDEAGYKYWTQHQSASDNRITADELEQLRQSFRQSSEYQQKPR